MNNPGYNSGNQMYQGRNPILSSNPAVNALKTIGSSGKFLAAAILVTVGVLISVATVLVGSSPLDSISALSGTDIDTEFSSYTYNIIMLISVALQIICAVGIWMTYMTCKSTESGGISTTGLTICKVICIINACLMGLAAAFSLLMCITIFILGNTGTFNDFAYYGFAFYAIIAAFFVVIVVIFLLMMLFYIFLAKTINRIKATAETGVPDNRISSFVIVWLWITGICSVLSGIIVLFFSPLAGLADFVGAVLIILFAIILSSYKAQMSALVSGYNVTSYAQPQANPVGVYTPPVQQPSYQQPIQQPSYQAPEVPKAPDIDSAEVQKQATSEVEDWLNTPPAQADRSESDDKDGGSDIQ